AYASLAASLAGAVKIVGERVAGHDLAGARAALRDAEQNICARCHMQFSWKMAADVSAWPPFNSPLTNGERREGPARSRPQASGGLGGEVSPRMNAEPR